MQDILPIVRLSLESATHALVDKALTCLSNVLTILDFSTIKNDLFPVVLSVFSKTTSMTIKVRCLETFTILCGGGASSATSDSDQNSNTILDKYTVQEKLVPALGAIKSKESVVIMAALSVFKRVGQIADSEFLAMDVLPILWAFSFGPLLNLRQFNEYMDLIRSLSSRIEQDHARKLRDLASNSTNGFDASYNSTDLMSSRETDTLSPASTIMAADFERLVLGNSPSSNAPTVVKQASDPFAAHQGDIPIPTSWSSNLVDSATSASSRAITPDSSFAFPQGNSSAFSGGNSGTLRTLQEPLQPTVMANPWMNPSHTGTTIGQPGSSVSSTASPSQPVPNMGMMSTRPFSAQQSSTFGGIVSMNGGPGMGGFPQSPQPPQRPLQGNGFMIAPPPSAGAAMKVRQDQNQSQGRKTGLDAYESLI